MRRIVKGREPRSLTEHRAAPHASYDNYPEKDELRSALLRDQGGLCCYCMSRIQPDRMKIEHWAAQEMHPERQLDFRNLLGCCLGGEGLPRTQQSCDTHKGSDAVSIDPADPQRNCEELITYHEDGEIDATRPDVRRDLSDVLNLNVWRLRSARKNVVVAVQEAMRRKYPGSWSRGTLEREIQRWQEPDESGMLRPYCQVVAFWLGKRLARAGK